MTAPEKMSDEAIHDCFQQRSKDKQSERRMIADAICAARDAQWQARLDAAVRDERADAGRYRCLRATSIEQWDKFAHYTDAALDAAVDAIRARNTQEGKL